MIQQSKLNLGQFCICSFAPSPKPILMLQVFWPFLGIQFLAPSPLPPPQQWLQRIYMYDTTKHPHVGFIKILCPRQCQKGPRLRKTLKYEKPRSSDPDVSTCMLPLPPKLYISKGTLHFNINLGSKDSLDPP